MTRLTGPSPRVHLSNYHTAHSAIAAMLLLSIACNISAIGNAVERGNFFKEVVEQTNEEGKRMEKEYPPGDTLPAGDLGSPVDPPLAPPPAAVASSPPALTGLQFPAEIPGDGTPKGGWFSFTDLGGDCTRAVFSVVSATNFAGFEFNPREIPDRRRLLCRHERVQHLVRGIANGDAAGHAVRRGRRRKQFARLHLHLQGVTRASIACKGHEVALPHPSPRSGTACRARTGTMRDAFRNEEGHAMACPNTFLRARARSQVTAPTTPPARPPPLARR